MSTKFKIGQKVKCPPVARDLVGVVTAIDDTDEYPILVRFPWMRLVSFTLEGRYLPSGIPILEIVKESPKPGFWRAEHDGTIAVLCQSSPGIYRGVDLVGTGWLDNEYWFQDAEYLGPLEWNEDGSLKFPKE